MADKQFALGGTRSAGYVEDEDPLAELARIVGFQEQPAVKQRNEAPAQPVRREPVVAEFPAQSPVQPSVSPGQNPVADLEDELLRAFEVYDAPRSQTTPPPAVNANQPLARIEPQPDLVTPEPAPAVHSPAFEAIDEDEDPFGALAAVVASQPIVQRTGIRPVEEPAQLRREPDFDYAEPAVAEPQAAAPLDHFVEEPSLSVDLLEQELLESLQEAEIAAPEPVAPVAPAPRRSVDSGYRLPLANFSLQTRASARVEPVLTQAAEPALQAAEAAPQQEVSWDLPGMEAEDMVVMDPPAASAVPENRDADGSMDSLLDDVARYDLPTGRAPSPPADPAFFASLAAISGVATEITHPSPKAAEPAVRQEPQMNWDAADSDFAASADEPDLDDLFGPGDFELDLDAFEQQLTDLSFDDAASFDMAEEPRPQAAEAYAAPVAEAYAAPVANAEDKPLEPFAEFIGEAEAHAPVEAVPAYEPEPPVRGPRFASVSFYQQLPADPEPFVAPQPAPVAMREPAPQPVSIPAPDYTIDDHAPFDPAMLAESEDAVETLGEIDVPEIQVQEDEEPAVVVPDYDLDIDAEMASLFGSLPPMTTQQGAKPATPTVSLSDVTHAAPAFGMPQRPNAAPADAFDEFERALEDDFRSMLSQPLGQPQPQPQKGQVQPPLADMQPPRSDNRTFRSMLLAACATGVLALAGIGGYFFLSGDVPELASSEPRIIAADKGPTKVVPENPGGVTVPNQDKAVYDRVAGKEADVVKQGALVTTEEEPVDVVQKTLVPENTLDAEAEAEAPAPVATPVEDTKDERLLPGDANAQAAGADDDQSNVPGGVAVRKVRTMIVKPDGTLVPREETAAAEPQPAADVSDNAPAAATGTAASLPASSAADAATAPATAEVPAAGDLRTGGEQPDATAAAQAPAVPAAADQPASAEALATVANSDVQAATPPVRTVRTSPVSDNAPVPQARPSDQPVNVTSTVTENGNVRPAAEQPQQTAVAEPAAAPAAPTGSYGVQIASLPSEADAKASIPKMSAKFGGVIGGRTIGIRKADIPGKGTYYRLRVDVGSKEDAVNLCLKLKAAGGSCLVSK